jgi:hypothetical protein
MKKLILVLFTSALALGTSSAVADAATLGITFPSGSPNTCGPDAVIAQATSDPATPYFVPGPGTITQWQTITPDDSSGEGVSLVVLRPVGDAFTVVAVDSRTIDDPAPDVSSFTLATPINVSGGETFGLYATGADVLCYFHGGSTPLGDTLAALDEPDPPAGGQTLERFTTDSPNGYAMNLAATFQPASTAPPASPAPPATHKKKCKKKKHKRSAESAKKKCKKKKKR